MKIVLKSNSKVRICSVQVSNNGEILLCIESEDNKDYSKDYYFETKIHTDITETKQVLNNDISICEYMLQYLKTSPIKNKTKTTFLHVFSYLKEYGDCKIKHITTSYLQKFLDFLKTKELKNNTINLYFQKLVRILRQAYYEELFDIRILKRVKKPKKETIKKNFLTTRELKRLYNTEIPNNHTNIKNMFLFSAACGLRFSDVSNLKWDNIKKDKTLYFIEYHQQKTDTNELLPLSQTAINILKSIKRTGSNVFQKETEPTVNTTLKQWCKKARIKKNISFHSARHTFCVLLLTSDVSIYTVQRLMCHSDINTTKQYADILDSTKLKTLKKLPVF